MTETLTKDEAEDLGNLIWTDKHGKDHRLKTMSPTYLRNAARVLRTLASDRVRDSERMLQYVHGDAATYYADRGVSQALDVQVESNHLADEMERYATWLDSQP